MSENETTTPQLNQVIVTQAAKTYFKAKTALKIISTTLAVILGASVAMFVTAYVATESKTFPILIKNAGGITVSESVGFETPTSKLNVTVPEAMTNISVFDIPSDVDGDDWVGAHNGDGYVAYTFFLKSTMEDETQTLNEKVIISLKSKGAEAAIRFKLYRNGVQTTYAKLATSGLPEYGTEPFTDDETVFDNTVTLNPGEIKRYTLVVWLEGDDPECIDDIMGGYVGFKVEFEANAEE